MAVIEGVERQRAIEKISVLKARYFRFLDTKDWEGLRDLFTPDAILFYPESNTPPMRRDEILPLMKDFLHDSITVHHGHMPEIEFTAIDRANGIWPMEDHVFFPPHRALALGMSGFWGYGHYHEDYVRQNDQGERDLSRTC